MEFAFLVYVIGTLFPAISGIGTMFALILIALVVVWIIGFPLVWFDERFKDQRKTFVTGTKTYLKWAVPIIIICSLVPSKEVSYTMIAAYTAQSIGENEKVQSIAGQSLEVISEFLEKTKKELEEENK